MKIGLISDTHGLMRREALEALEGSDLILHAGDIGAPAVLEALEELGPVVAVRGNNDKGAWASALPETEFIETEAGLIYLLHDVKELDLDPTAAGICAVVSGHSHEPVVEMRKGVLFVNPGSAGPRRFKLPIAVGRLEASTNGVTAEVVILAVNGG